MGEVERTGEEKPFRLTAVERREIIRAHLVDGLNRLELADRFGRDRHSIARVLESDEAKALERDLDEAVREEVQRELRRGRVGAARHWRGIAEGRRGKTGSEHKAARELLQATGDVSEDNRGPRVVVNVGIALPGLPPPAGQNTTPALPAGGVVVVEGLPRSETDSS
jgi:hypothetical protein